MNQPRMCVVLFVRPQSEELAGMIARGELAQVQHAIVTKIAEGISSELSLDSAFGDWADVDDEGNPIVTAD